MMELWTKIVIDELGVREPKICVADYTRHKDDTMDENTLPGEGTSACGIWLKVPEAAAILGISRRTLYNWVSARLIASYKIGRSVRFKRSEIESLFELGRRRPV